MTNSSLPDNMDVPENTNNLVPSTIVETPDMLRRLVFSFIVLLGFSLFLVGFSILNFQRLDEANNWNIHTYRVLQTTGDIDRTLADIDIEVRNFVLTGKKEQLEQYPSHLQTFQMQWKEAYDLTRDHRLQQQRLQALQTEVKVWQQHLEQAIRTRRATPNTENSLKRITPRALVRAQVLSRMRDMLNEMERTEEQLLVLRQQEQEALQRRTAITLWSGAIFSILLSGGLLALVANNANSLSQANFELARSNAQIEAARQAAERAQIVAERANLELQRSNEELGHFAYVASHDLQEPLRAISGCVQLLQRRYGGQLDERADQFISHAVDGAQRMQTLIVDLLAYSRVGTRDQKFGPIEVDSLIDQVKKSLSAQVAESGAQIRQDAMPTIMGDAQQLEQVWQNFISNAIKFHGDKTPQIHLGAVRDEDNAGWVFSVTDQGPGIEPQYFERIWVMFQRLHTRSEYPGTGIGLAICKKIVERHGGTVVVESEFGKGTTFRFFIPDKPEDNRPLAQSE